MPNELEELMLRQAPHAVAAEQYVLGAILYYPKCVAEVAGSLRPDDFYVQKNREIYETIYTMFSYSRTIDPVTVLENLKQNGYDSDDQAWPYLLQLMRNASTAANVGLYIQIIKDKTLLRQLLETSQELVNMVQEGTETGQTLLDAAEQRIYAIRQGRSVQGLTPIADIIINVYDRLEELAASDRAVTGLETGLRDLDRALSGLNNSDLILLAARPGMGKTSMALNILLHAGKKSHKQVAFFSLEMNKEQLALRLISSECFVDNKKLITGKLSDEDWENVAAAADSLSRSTILIDEDSNVTVADILAKCRRVENLGLIVIDYLQLMQSSGGKTRSSDNRQQVVSDISRSLKLMAKELNVPVLCLSQLSRANESRTDKRPMLSDLRESGAIEQDADIVLFLYREGYYNRDTENPNLAECIIAKNRHGETGKIDLQWSPEFTTFTDTEWRREEY